MGVAEETVQEHLEDPTVLEAWGVKAARKYTRWTAIIHFILLAALAIAFACYFLFADAALRANRISGLIIVVLLVYAVSGMRFFQLKAERQDLPAFIAELSRKLNGEDAHDMAAQEEVEMSYLWPSRHYSIIGRMAGFTALAVLCINSYQLGQLDILRTVVFDIAIATYLVGSLWNNCAFKAELLYAELEARLRASLKFRDEEPEAYAAQYASEVDDDGYSDDEVDFSQDPAHQDQEPKQLPGKDE